MTRKEIQTIYKMIVLVSNPGAMRSVFEQLKSRNVLVYPISSLDAAMKILRGGAVDYCMLSVDNSKLDLNALPQEIENTLNIPVIVISELRDKKSMWRLTQVRTKNILYSKANAQNIYQRIELIRNAQENSKSKSNHLLVAEQTENADRQRNLARQATKDSSPSNLLLIADAPKAKPQPRILAGPLPKFGSIGTVKITNETKFRGVPPANIIKVAPPAPEKAQEIIIGCLKNVLGEFANSDELAEQTHEYSRSMVISVKSKAIVGTFLIATESDAPKLGDIQNQLYDYLRSVGFDWDQEEIKVEILTDQKLPAELIKAGVYVAGVAKEGEVAISYFPEAVEVPELVLSNSSQHLLDPKNLVKNTRINFDIFLHLRANSKDLHYVKTGSDIDQKQIQKLKTGTLTAFVPRNQLANLNEYVLLQRLLKLMNPDAIDEEVEELLRIS